MSPLSDKILARHYTVLRDIISTVVDNVEARDLEEIQTYLAGTLKATFDANELEKFYDNQTKAKASLEDKIPEHFVKFMLHCIIDLFNLVHSPCTRPELDTRATLMTISIKMEQYYNKYIIPYVAQVNPECKDRAYMFDTLTRSFQVYARNLEPERFSKYDSIKEKQQ